MTDFRALCVELVDCLEKADWPLRHRYVFRQWIDIARAALAKADEPAVPEGREPASVTGQPSDENLLELAEDWPATTGPRHDLSGCPEVPLYSVFADEVVEFARAVLARWGCPAPVPAEAEVEKAPAVTEVIAWLRTEAEIDDGFELTQSAADLLHRLSPPQPVPVSERLPGPEDCNAEGRCWWWYPEVPGKTYGYWAHEDDAVPERAFNEQPSHWLPATALPLPGQEVR